MKPCVAKIQMSDECTWVLRVSDYPLYPSLCSGLKDATENGDLCRGFAFSSSYVGLELVECKERKR